MELDQDREVAVDRRAVSHLPGLRSIYKCARIENVRCLGQLNPLDPCGIDNIDRESSQAWSQYMVTVGFDGVWMNARKSGKGACFDMTQAPYR
jgi:hypothetical protein